MAAASAKRSGEEERNHRALRRRHERARHPGRAGDAELHRQRPDAHVRVALDGEAHQPFCLSLRGGAQ